ncbi:TolA protein [Christensenella hongkongensis]|uniref:TolA protein n=2 Tax=Christensenella hongkongensis TaxID=270498 RepID=A0A0M2NJM4_9FIRM|nr:TolA protein [Christensenella hongkongensis]
MKKASFLCSKRKEKAMAYTDKGKIKARQNRLAEQRLRRQQEEKQRRKEEEERKRRQEEARRRQEEAARRKERQERQRQEHERKQKEAAKKVSGESIKATQFLMNRFGFTDKQGNPLKEDGIFGDKTKQAAEKFQRYQKELDQPSQKTKTLQEGLNQSGRTYLDGNPLKVDGVYGPKTDHMKNVVDNDFTGWLDSDRYKEKTIGTKIFPRMPKLENKAVNDIAEGRWSKLWDSQEDAARTMEYRIPIDEKEKKEINLPGSYIGTEREEKDVRELQDLFKNAINEQKQSWNGKDMVYNKETNRKNANIELLGSQVEARPTQPPKEETDKSGNLWSENWNAAPQYGNGEASLLKNSQPEKGADLSDQEKLELGKKMREYLQQHPDEALPNGWNIDKIREREKQFKADSPLGMTATPPGFVKNEEDIKKLQQNIGVEPTGKWDSTTEIAYHQKFEGLPEQIAQSNPQIAGLDFNDATVKDRACISTATNNMLQMAGVDVPYKDIYEWYMEKGVPIGSAEMPVGIVNYIRENNPDIKIAGTTMLDLGATKKAEQQIKDAGQGIVCFGYKAPDGSIGAHYVAVEALDDGKISVKDYGKRYNDGDTTQSGEKTYDSIEAYLKYKDKDKDDLMNNKFFIVSYGIGKGAGK